MRGAANGAPRPGRPRTVRIESRIGAPCGKRANECRHAAEPRRAPVWRRIRHARETAHPPTGRRVRAEFRSARDGALPTCRLGGFGGKQKTMACFPPDPLSSAARPRAEARLQRVASRRIRRSRRCRSRPPARSPESANRDTPLREKQCCRPSRRARGCGSERLQFTFEPHPHESTRLARQRWSSTN